MRHFHLSSKMTTMRGVFYPTGHMVLMFPTEKDALRAARLLQADGVSEDEMFIATPEEFEREIAGATDEHGSFLFPSIGTEGETAQHFRQLAHQGHHALMIHASAKISSDHVVDLLKDTHITYGQRYRHLVIEDLVR